MPTGGLKTIAIFECLIDPVLENTAGVPEHTIGELLIIERAGEVYDWKEDDLYGYLV